MSKVRLTGFRDMPKKAKNPKKLGREEVIDSDKLLDRHQDLKQFFEHNWGRIGLELQRVRKPDEVEAILRLVPSVEWCPPFREEAHLGCLLKKGGTKVEWRELRQTREQHSKAVDNEHCLRLQYYETRQQAEEAITALKAACNQFALVLSFLPFFATLFLLSKRLGVQELSDKLNHVGASYLEAQKKRQELEESLTSQLAWYSRNEIVEFVRSKRYVGTPVTFAKAMAGLPEYRWLHSFRKCEAIQERSTRHVEYAYQIFELLKVIVRKTKPLNLSKVEVKLREKLLQEDIDPVLRSHIAPKWAYMKQAFAECQGKRFRRSELPYKIMGRFLENSESPRTIAEAELAKRDQLV
jgi:hypothetical protein